VSESLSPCGLWRLVMCRLGASGGSADRVGALARIDSDGTVKVFADGGASAMGIGAWRAAGPGRVVLIVEWLVSSRVARPPGQVSVRAAAELSTDGRRCAVRLQWQRLDLDGQACGAPVQAQAQATRLEP
jgi:hypothetical protein